VFRHTAHPAAAASAATSPTIKSRRFSRMIISVDREQASLRLSNAHIPLGLHDYATSKSNIQ